MTRLTVSDLQVGKTYCIVDIGDAELGGCKLVHEDKSFTVSHNDGLIMCSIGDAAFWDDSDQEWALFHPYNTTTFEEVIKGE